MISDTSGKRKKTKNKNFLDAASTKTKTKQKPKMKKQHLFCYLSLAFCKMVKSEILTNSHQLYSLRVTPLLRKNGF